MVESVGLPSRSSTMRVAEARLRTVCYDVAALL
jgi:hypothetical protein